jgi:hypothetical protein
MPVWKGDVKLVMRMGWTLSGSEKYNKHFWHVDQYIYVTRHRFIIYKCCSVAYLTIRLNLRCLQWMIEKTSTVL